MNGVTILLLSCLLTAACVGQEPRVDNRQMCLEMVDAVWVMSTELLSEFAKRGSDTRDALASANKRLMSNKNLCFDGARAGPDYLDQAIVHIADQGKMIAQGVLSGLEIGLSEQGEISND